MRSASKWVSLVGTLLVTALTLAACGSPGKASGSGAIIRQVGPAQTNPHYPGALLSPKVVHKPAFTLTDTSGQPFNLAAETRGALTLVYFGYTNCPDVCPLNMFTIAAALKSLPAETTRHVKVVFVTTDPARDTPLVIRTWLDHFNSSFIGLDGSLGQIHAAEAADGIPLSFAEQASSPGSSYAIVHSGYVLAFTPDDMAHLELMSGITPAQEAHDISQLVTHGWQAT